MSIAVSVIVPVYGVEKYLPRCMDSLLGQTLRQIEIILVDDESPDGCPEMCDAYQKMDDRVRVIHKKNGGLGFARNSGLEIARGEYVAFVDSDDYVEHDMFACMYKSAKEYDADFVRADNYRETRDGRILNSTSVLPMREGLYKKEEMCRELLFPQFGLLPEDGGEKYVSCSVWRNLYRREIVCRTNIRFVSEREMISEDMIFNFQFMTECSRAFVIKRKFYHYVVNDQSLTQSYRPDRFQKERIFFHELERRLRKAGVYEDCSLRLQRHLLDRLRNCIKRELCGNPHAAAGMRNVRTMITAPEVRQVLTQYPLNRMPIKYRAVYTMIKYRCVGLLALLRRKL